MPLSSGRGSGCFTKLNQSGVDGGYPRKNRGWALEAALDLQMISASCPRCKLVLVEANNPFFGPMLKAVDTAAAHADVVSNSYGAYEFTGIKRMARHYDVDGVPMTVASGDSATSRRTSRPRRRRSSRSAARRSGMPTTTAADVAAVGDPRTGVAVYDSFGFAGEKGWFVLGGTSAGAPLVAGMIAAAGDADTFTGADLYANPDALHDVTAGTNRVFQMCRGSYMATPSPATTHKPATAPPTEWRPSPT